MSYLARRNRYAINIWPGFVDALATLVLVFIFMLVVFVFAQFGLSDALNKRTSDVEDLVSQTDLLNQELTEQQRLNSELQRALTDLEQQRQRQLDELQQEINALQDQWRQLNLYTDQLTEKLAQTQADSAQARDQQTVLEGQLELAQRRSETLESRIKALSARMARQNSTLVELSAELQTHKLQQQILRDRLTQANSAASRRAELEKTLGEVQVAEADRRVELLRMEQTLKDLSEQNSILSKLLNKSAEQLSERDEEIVFLQHRLEENLQKDEGVFSGYRSEFFTRLREVLGDHPDIRVVGDRFLFQSELLFASSSAELGSGGKTQLDRVAETLLEISRRIPSDVNWVLQVNGHTDRRPINTPRFPSNWELSTERALSIVRYLIKLGIPPQRLAATGFAEFDPIDPAENIQAYSRNRRIELKFTSR